METEHYKNAALEYCVNIYRDYEESEVLKFAPKSVQQAWYVGRNFLAEARKKDNARLKDFTL